MQGLAKIVAAVMNAHASNWNLLPIDGAHVSQIRSIARASVTWMTCTRHQETPAQGRRRTKWRAVLSPSCSQWHLEAQNRRTAIRRSSCQHCPGCVCCGSNAQQWYTVGHDLDNNFQQPVRFNLVHLCEVVGAFSVDLAQRVYI